MKFKYRIIKKKVNDYYSIEKQTIEQTFFWKNVSRWSFEDLDKTIEECELKIKQKIEYDKLPEMIVIKEYE